MYRVFHRFGDPARTVSASSTIEWTDATWNPVSGCTKVSPGCDHCYAERITERFGGAGSFATVRLHHDRLEAPLHWRRPRRVFVNSMGDLFHVDVPTEFAGRVWETMRLTPQHTYQVLTKRAERMERVVRDYLAAPPPTGAGVLPNVWLGVSVESPDQYSRIRHLQRTPAAVRFLSCEPLLTPLPNLPLEGIDWVIVGGESGPGARPMHPLWAADIAGMCARARIPFFFKQWGAWAPLGAYHGVETPCPHRLWAGTAEHRPGERAHCRRLIDDAVRDARRAGTLALLTYDGATMPLDNGSTPRVTPPLWAEWMARRAGNGRVLLGRTHDAMPR